jgi:hypothetical protein
MVASAGGLPRLQWQTGAAAVDAVPLPRPRPLDLGLAQVDRRDTTASLPAVITGGDDELPVSQVLAYAPEAGLTRNDGVLSRALANDQPALETLVEPSEVPLTLLAAAMVQYTPELRHPEIAGWRSMIAPAQTAVTFGFGRDLNEAPTTRFSGPAVVVIPSIAIGRSAAGSRLTGVN